MTAEQVVAGLVFAVTFVMVLSDRVDRTIVAMAGAAAMVGMGTLMGFYSQEEALQAIDFNTLGLLLGIMIWPFYWRRLVSSSTPPSSRASSPTEVRGCC